MIRVTLDFDPGTMALTDKVGNVTYATSVPVSLDPPLAQTILELIKQGLSADEVIKLKNTDLL